MRLGALAVCVLFPAMVGCHEDNLVPPPTPATTVPPPDLDISRRTLSLVQSPESPRQGRGAAAFIAEGDGPIAALFLVSVDAQGKPDGLYVGDTLASGAALPTELGTPPGARTSRIGVVEEGNALLNGQDNGEGGALPVLRAGPHRLVLTMAKAATLAAGSHIRVYAQRPDGALVAGATTTLATRADR